MLDSNDGEVHRSPAVSFVGAPSKRDDRWRASFSIATHVARCSEAAPLWCMGGSPVEPPLASVALFAPPVLRRALGWPAPSAPDLRAEGRGRPPWLVIHRLWSQSSTRVTR